MTKARMAVTQSGTHTVSVMVPHSYFLHLSCCQKDSCWDETGCGFRTSLGWPQTVLPVATIMGSKELIVPFVFDVMQLAEMHRIRVHNKRT